MHNAFLGVEPADIEWRPAKLREGSTGSPPLIPYSKQFNDIYFDTRDGIAEANYVFIDGNNLPERFETLTHNQFVIIETGFGTGLNFLQTCKLWKELAAKRANPQARLEFISIEQYPITPHDLKAMYKALGIESDITEQLLQQYPPAMPGVYSIELEGQITLTLLLSPIDKALKEFAAGSDFKVDAWFLDGFAPSRNPQMWSKGLLHFMALHATNTEQRRTTFATFTAASAVRKQIHHFGFEVAKQKGFGFKREMLVGSFIDKVVSAPHPSLASNYFLAPSHKPIKVAVIGAGLAGCATVYALYHKNIEVHLFERGSQLAGGASKIPALLATPNISIDHNAFSQLTFAGMHHLKRYIEQHPELNHSDTCIQLASEKHSQWQLKQYIDVYQQRFWNHGIFRWDKTNILGQQHSGLLMPSVLVNGERFCQSLVKDIPSEQLHFNHGIESLAEVNEFDYVILATGHRNVLNKLANNEPALSPLRGQLTVCPKSSQQPLNLEYPVNYDGHLFEMNNDLMIGATFDVSLDERATIQDREKNLNLANQRFDTEFKDNKNCHDYVGIRATTYDRFPFCGPLSQPDNSPMVWTNYGFGTRGLCLSLLCAKVIANALNHEPIPLPKYLLQRISPLRTKKT